MSITTLSHACSINADVVYTHSIWIHINGLETECVSFRVVSGPNHKVGGTTVSSSSSDQLQLKMTGFVLLIIVVTPLLNVVAQPGNRTDGKSHKTCNGALTADQPLLQLANNTVCAEDDNPEAPLNSCIRSLADLRHAYLDLKTAPGSRPRDSTIFIFHPTDAVKYTSLAIFYDLSTEESEEQALSFSLNKSTSDCCNPENTNNCKVFLRHQSHLYRAIYPSLVFLYAFPTEPNKVGKLQWFRKRIGKYTVNEFCWKVPPLCTSSEMVVKNGDINKVLEAFTAEVRKCQCMAVVHMDWHHHRL